MKVVALAAALCCLASVASAQIAPRTGSSSFVMGEGSEDYVTDELRKRCGTEPSMVSPRTCAIVFVGIGPSVEYYAVRVTHVRDTGSVFRPVEIGILEINPGGTDVRKTLTPREFLLAYPHEALIIVGAEENKRIKWVRDQRAFD